MIMPVASFPGTQYREKISTLHTEHLGMKLIIIWANKDVQAIWICQITSLGRAGFVIYHRCLSQWFFSQFITYLSLICPYTKGKTGIS